MSSGSPSSDPNCVPAITDEDVQAMLDEFGGDVRAAIRALVHDLDMLARDHAASVSRGYVRGETWSLDLPSRRGR